MNKIEGIPEDGYLIEGELVDTYGGDFTYQDIRYEWDEEFDKYRFYESYTGAKPQSEEEVINPKELQQFYNQLNSNTL